MKLLPRKSQLTAVCDASSLLRHVRRRVRSHRIILCRPRRHLWIHLNLPHRGCDHLLNLLCQKILLHRLRHHRTMIVRHKSNPRTPVRRGPATMTDRASPSATVSSRSALHSLHNYPTRKRTRIQIGHRRTSNPAKTPILTSSSEPTH